VRVCIIGKFPPIQGGVSMRTYRAAHALAARGHEVHVVTNAKEAEPPFRMYMRAQDWERCEARYGAGSVRVHWTDPVDRSQSYIPMASPFVTKLAAIAARVHSEYPFDVIYSHYLEPYGVAGHLAAQMASVPHVARMAGSDAGRLWHHPQFETLYDHVLRSAEVVIAAGAVAERAVEHGVAPERIAYGGQFVVPEDLFTPDGPALDLAALRAEVEMEPELRDLTWGEFAGDRPYFGVCGKLGESKGSFTLLAAMHRLKQAGLKVGLVALAHGQPAIERRFRARARKLGLTDRILQIPFLPHWRVPEFLRGCLAVCCLEQDFPIGFHTPMIPFEVLLCGTCLVASTEVIAKLPSYGRLPHGYGCVAIEDVNDVEALSSQLAAIVQDPKPAAAVGLRGRTFARDLQRDATFPQILEHILKAAAARQPVALTTNKLTVNATIEAQELDFPLSQLAQIAIGETGQIRGPSATVPLTRTIDLARVREVLAAVERAIDNGQINLKPFASAVQIEIAIATAVSEAAATGADPSDPLFRLHMGRWAMEDGDLAGLVPERDRQLRILEFDHDVSKFLGVQTVAEFPTALTLGRSYVVAFGRSGGALRNPILVDGLTAQILELSNGTRTISEIVGELDQEMDGSAGVNNLKWIESLFVHGLISLRNKRIDLTIGALPNGVGTRRNIHRPPSRRSSIKKRAGRRPHH
jgi:glycosyltransferase involved in cell wall biosynthesis